MAVNVRPLNFSGAWLVDDRRYFENAQALLVELEQLTDEVKQRWPKPLNTSIKQEEAPKDLWDLTRKRDRLSDSVKVFSAMSVEAFLNFYGVLRLGEAEYAAQFEGPRPRGLIGKLKELLDICDSISLADDDEICSVLRRIAGRRNALVHPRTREVTGYLPAEDRAGDKIPEVAREAVADMVRFFELFVSLIPGAAMHVPKQTVT